MSRPGSHDRSQSAGPGGWAARRFWTQADIRAGGSEGADGWQVMLDGRVLRTPGRQVLSLPTRALARAIAAEWDAQGEFVQPATMPLTRAANSAVERVTPQHASVAAMLAEYAQTDLLSHRAEAPAELVATQAREWDPLLDWLDNRFGARLAVTAGVMPVAQDKQALARLEHAVLGLGPFSLTALHDLVVLPGSLVLGLAVTEGRIGVDDAHRLSRIDEDHQARIWGHDPEADAVAARRSEALHMAWKFWDLLADARGDGRSP